MALTRITKGVIKPNENYDTHNIVSTGIVTSVGLDVNGSADISGSLSVGGVLTYEDVTSIDSVGLITARSGIFVPLGASSIGIGSQSPQAKLDIYRNDASDAGTIQINQGGTGDASMDFQLKGVREYTLGIDNSDSDKFKLSSIAGLGNNDLVTITTSGYVGINTSNPVNALEVLGKSGNTDTIAGVTVHEIARFNADTSEKLGLKLALDNTNKVFYLHRSDNGGDFAVSMRSGGQSLERLRIKSDGKVGINSAIPQATLEIHDIGSTGPCLLLHGGSTTEGDIVTIDGEALGFGHWNSQTTTYTERFRINSSGHALPGTNNQYDLGSTTLRWANVYTNDLHLSNQGTTNSVDNTWGDFTIQEGESDLFLINNRSGKKYKFNLTEVS